jgi:putative transposase
LLQNHYRDLKPGYDHLLRNLKAAQAVIASQSAIFRRCYGPEYISETLRKWAEKNKITIQHIQPGQRQQNAYIERYNRTVRHEWLDQYIIETIEEAQDQATQWLWNYNNDRPNMGIGGITPAMKLKMAA